MITLIHNKVLYDNVTIYRYHSSAVKKNITKIDWLCNRSVLGPSNLPQIYCIIDKKEKRLKKMKIKKKHFTLTKARELDLTF